MTSLAFGGLYGWTTAWVLGGFVAFLVALPAFLWVESHKAEPLLDLSLFRDPPVRDGQPDLVSSTGSRATACCSCSCSTSRA